METMIYLFVYLFAGFFDEHSLKEQHLFEIKIFGNIINVFTFTFDNCNVSLLNKYLFIYLFKKN